MNDPRRSNYSGLIETTEPGDGSESELHDLLSAAGDACISFYMANHVSDMGARPQPEKKLWSIGQELYLAKQKGR
jgi:hypothetical protein